MIILGFMMAFSTQMSHETQRSACKVLWLFVYIGVMGCLAEPRSTQDHPTAQMEVSAQRLEASSHLSMMQDFLATASDPMTLQQLEQHLPATRKQLELALEYSPVTPTKVLWEDHRGVDVDPDFFDGKLMGYFTYQGSSKIGSYNRREKTNLIMGAHFPLRVERREGFAIDLYNDSLPLLHNHEVSAPPVLKIFLGGSSKDSASKRVVLGDSSLFPNIVNHKKTWIRDVRYAKNLFSSEPYLTVEFAALVELTASNDDKVLPQKKAHLFNFSLTIIPHKPSQRSFDPSSVWKVLPLRSLYWSSGNFVHRELNWSPRGHDPGFVQPWYMVVYDPELYQGELAQMVVEAARDGIESWNIYSRTGGAFVKFHGLLPPGIKIGDHGYSFLLLARESWKSTDRAYATSAYDPVSGEHSSDFVYIPSFYVDANHGRGPGFMVLPEEEPPSYEEKEGVVESFTSFMGLSRLQETHQFSHATLFEDSALQRSSLEIWQENPEFFHYQLGFFRGFVYHEVGHALGMDHNFKASVVSYEELPLSGMDYLSDSIMLGLFAEGPLKEPLDYDQAFMDVFYNKVPDEKVAVLPVCAEWQSAYSDSYELYDWVEEKVFSGIDPFCKSHDLFHSVEEGIRFMNDRLKKDVTISGFRVRSFISYLLEDTLTEEASSSVTLEEEEESSWIPPAEDSAAMFASATSTDVEDLEVSEGSSSEEVDDVALELAKASMIHSFSMAVGDYFFYSSTSFYYVVKANHHRLMTWMPYKELLEFNRGKIIDDNYFRYEDSRFWYHYNVFGLLKPFKDLARGTDLSIRSGLERFSYALEYDIHRDSEQKLLLGIFEDVVSLVAGRDDFQVFPSAPKLAEIACDLESVAQYFEHESACLETLTPEARKVMVGVGDRFLQSYTRFLRGLNLERQNQRKELEKRGYIGELVRGYLSSDVVKKMIEIIGDRYDIMRASFQQGTRLTPTALEEVLDIVWLLLNRPSGLDYRAMNLVKADMKIAIQELSSMRIAEIDKKLGEKNSEKLEPQLLSEKRLWLEVNQKYHVLPKWKEEEQSVRDAMVDYDDSEEYADSGGDGTEGDQESEGEP